MGTYRRIVGISKSFPAAALAVVAVAAFCPLADAASPAELTFPSGLSATIVPADYLRDRVVSEPDGPAIQLDDGRLLPVITDVNDPSIYNHGDGDFHPFTLEQVKDALAAVHHPRMRVAVRVYVLPYPRRGLLTSSTSGNEIFLSPHVLEIDPAVAAYIVAHELGHAFHNRFMPDGSAAWTEYRRLRQIDDGRFSESAAHAYRPKEIFAEDFRVLFGGTLAAFGGQLENTELSPPASVAGLEQFYLRTALPVTQAGSRAVIATSYPNPFNPETEIRVTLPAELQDTGAPVAVRVYAVTGALVRDLHAGFAAGNFAVRWDGRDNAGHRVASNTYYAAVEVGDERETLKLVLMK